MVVGRTVAGRGKVLIAAFLYCLCLADHSAWAATAMVVYGRSGAGSPRYRTWNGSAWTTEASANSLAAFPEWVVLRGSPLTNHFALATLDNTDDIEVQIWNGSAWSTLFQATNDAGTHTRRVFDLAYEQLSGHLLLVYRESGTTEVRYRTHDGTAWSAESSYAMTSSNPRWLQLIPKRGSDEMMITCIGNSGAIHKAAMWNGSSFTNQTDLDGVDEPNTRREHADGAFEGVSGQGLVAYNQDSHSPGYRTLTSATWSSVQNAPSPGAQTQWTRMASDSLSDEIIMTTLDQGNDVNVTIWNGSGWGSPFEIETNTPYSDRRAMDVAYEPQGNEALVAFDDNTNTLKYRTWDGFGWSVEMPGPSGGSAPLWNPQAVTGMVSGQVFVTYCTDDRQIRSVVWGGSAFGSALTLAVSSGDKEHETFMVAIAGLAAAPKIVSWQELER